jgi:hypothetical protein
VGTIAVDTIGIVVASLGFLNPLLAAFIHVASEMTFILNSARMLPGAASSSYAVDAPRQCAPTQIESEPAEPDLAAFHLIRPGAAPKAADFKDS